MWVRGYKRKADGADLPSHPVRSGLAPADPPFLPSFPLSAACRNHIHVCLSAHWQPGRLARHLLSQCSGVASPCRRWGTALNWTSLPAPQRASSIPPRPLPGLCCLPQRGSVAWPHRAGERVCAGGGGGRAVMSVPLELGFSFLPVDMSKSKTWAATTAPPPPPRAPLAAKQVGFWLQTAASQLSAFFP